MAKKVLETVTEQTVTVIEPTKESIMATYKTKSAAIRHLLSTGMTRSAVANFLGVRYQHVRNVEITPIKKVAEVKTVTKTEEPVEQVA